MANGDLQTVGQQIQNLVPDSSAVISTNQTPDDLSNVELDMSKARPVAAHTVPAAEDLSNVELDMSKARPITAPAASDFSIKQALTGPGTLAGQIAAHEPG